MTIEDKSAIQDLCKKHYSYSNFYVRNHFLKLFSKVPDDD